MKFRLFRRRMYVDHAAATPVSRHVLRTMAPYWRLIPANPGALHKGAVIAKRAIEKSRLVIAKLSGIQPRNVLFAPGGTAAVNLAIRGVVKATKVDKPHIVATAIEHHAVLETLADLDQRGEATVTLVPVDPGGMVSPRAIREALTPQTVLVCAIYGHNEIGVVQPIRDITREVRHYKKHTLDDPHALYPLVFTDGIQAAAYGDIHMPRLGVDIMTISAAKMYGPKGSAALLINNPSILRPIVTGGSQEFGLWAGTENVPLIVGLAAAYEDARARAERDAVRLARIQSKFFDMIDNPTEMLARHNIRVIGHREQRLPHNIMIALDGISSEELVLGLDAVGISASAHSACIRDRGVSHVRRALGIGEKTGTVRITLGRSSRLRDARSIMRALEKILLRKERAHTKNDEKVKESV